MASNDDDRHLAFSIKKYIYGPGWSWYGERSLRKLVVVVVRWETQVRREGRRMGMRTQPRESMLNFVCPRSHEPELDLVHFTAPLHSNHHGVSAYPSNVSYFEYLAFPRIPSNPWMDRRKGVNSLDLANRFTACNSMTYFKCKTSELARTSLKLSDLKTHAAEKHLRLICSGKYSEKAVHSFK